MFPDNEYVNVGMCSAEPGKQYFVFLPEGGNTQIDLSAVKPDAQVVGLWMDIWTGERVEQQVDELKFTTDLKNPLSHLDTPCALYLSVRTD